MADQLKRKVTRFERWAPHRFQRLLTLPTPWDGYDRDGGRCELFLGRPGAGKTTWASIRAKRILGWREDDTKLCTTGIGWPDPWVPIHSLDEFLALRNAVLVFDEYHLVLPSSRGLLPPHVEDVMIDFLSNHRKHEVDLLATTQAWTRGATHLRHLVEVVWKCQPCERGKLHLSHAHVHPESGGHQLWPGQYYGPSAAAIPTKSRAWWPGLGNVSEEHDDIRRQASLRAPADALASWPAPERDNGPATTGPLSVTALVRPYDQAS